MNSFEHEARAKKVQTLVRCLNALVVHSEIGLNPNRYRDRLVIAEMVRRLNDREWSQLAINAGSRPPSEATRAAVINEYTKTVVETGRLVNEAF